MNSLNDTFSIKKCEHCEQWTNGNKAFCEKCGEILDLEYRKERDDKSKDPKAEPFLINWFKFDGSRNNILYFLIEKGIQGGQLILMGIIALITLILLLLPG
ncbi:MAG: hypothetical protein ACOVP1_11575 [Bacteroidia bacterium]